MNHAVDYIKQNISVIIPFTIGGTILFFTFLTFFDFFEPYLFPLHMMQGKARQVTEKTIVGPYPRESELARLKSTYNVTSVISLLNAKDLPQENALLIKEEKLCKKYHLRLLSFPLSYLSLESHTNQQTMKEVLRYINEHPKEMFYIHCYLGKHRVGKVEELLKVPELSINVQIR
jgi:hypothetical protein